MSATNTWTLRIIPKEDHLRPAVASIAGFGAIYDPSSYQVHDAPGDRGRPSKASAEKGKRLNEESARLVVDLIDKFRTTGACLTLEEILET